MQSVPMLPASTCHRLRIRVRVRVRVRNRVRVRVRNRVRARANVHLPYGVLAAGVRAVGLPGEN